MSFALHHLHGEGLLEALWIRQRVFAGVEHQIWLSILSLVHLHPARLTEHPRLSLIVESEHVRQVGQRTILHGPWGPVAGADGRQGVLPDVVEVDLRHAGHRVRDLVGRDEAEEPGEMVLGDRVRSVGFQRAMQVADVAGCGVQFERLLDSRVVVELWPLAAQVHRLALDVLVVKMHDDVVCPQLRLVGALEPPNRAEVVELHQG